MKKYQVRFQYTTSNFKSVDFGTKEAAQRFIDKVIMRAKTNRLHGKVSLWENGWGTQIVEF